MILQPDKSAVGGMKVVRQPGEATGRVLHAVGVELRHGDGRADGSRGPSYRRAGALRELGRPRLAPAVPGVDHPAGRGEQRDHGAEDELQRDSRSGAAAGHRGAERPRAARQTHAQHDPRQHRDGEAAARAFGYSTRLTMSHAVPMIARSVATKGSSRSTIETTVSAPNGDGMPWKVPSFTVTHENR